MSLTSRETTERCSFEGLDVQQATQNWEFRQVFLCKLILDFLKSYINLLVGKQYDIAKEWEIKKKFIIPLFSF